MIYFLPVYLYLFLGTQENSANFLCSIIALFFIHCNSDVENILLSLQFRKNTKLQFGSLDLEFRRQARVMLRPMNQVLSTLPTMVFC